MSDGRLDREFRASKKAIVEAIKPLGDFARRTSNDKFHEDPDRVTVEVPLVNLRFDVVRHARGVAVEVWLDGERRASMGAGQEVELVMYGLLLRVEELSKEKLALLQLTNEYMTDVKRSNPEAWERYKAIGKETA